MMMVRVLPHTINIGDWGRGIWLILVSSGGSSVVDRSDLIRSGYVFFFFGLFTNSLIGSYIHSS